MIVCQMQVIYDAAGAIADAAQVLQGQLTIVPTDATYFATELEIANNDSFGVVVAGVIRYRCNFLGPSPSWAAVIPWGCKAFMHLNKVSGAVFPANTNLNVSMMALMTPNGVQLPR